MTRKHMIVALALAIAAAAVFTSSAGAMARIDNGATGTPLVKKYVSNGYGGVKAVYVAPDYQSSVSTQAETSTPIFRDQPDGLLPRNETSQVSVANGSSVDWSEIALGFAFGLALAMLGALGILALQRTVRTQH